jgi:lysozyme
MFNRSQLIADLERDEGLRVVPYDDKTGRPFQQGDRLFGNLTNGIGWNMRARPLTEAQARVICGWHVDDDAQALDATFPWLARLTEARQRAVANLCFNMGLATLKTFVTFLTFLKDANYPAAADDLKSTAWYRQTGDRAKRIEALIRAG